MKARTLASIAILGAGLVAQGQPQEAKTVGPINRGNPVKTTPVMRPKNGVSPTPVTQPQIWTPPQHALKAEHQPAANSAHLSAQSVLNDPNNVMFDQPQTGGALWTRTANFKASFDANGVEFTARPLPGGPSEPIHFNLAGAQVGNKALNVDGVMPARSDRRVEYRHRDLVEAYDVSGNGIEQTFTFATLPVRGELSLDLKVDTDLSAQNNTNGVTFSSQWDNVSYSQAVAIDAKGERVNAETSFSNGHLNIRVPASFVAQAVLPLVIDPLIASITPVPHSIYGNSDLNPDVAYDSSTDTWAVVFTEYWSTIDRDCYVVRLDTNYNYLGITQIDFTSNEWNVPRIANLRAYGLFMVVAQVSADDPAPYWISARQMDNAGNLPTGQFDIYNAAPFTDSINPDVGGDFGGAPTYFTVCFEYCYSPTDHDIYACQVDNAGVVQPMIYVQTDTNNQTNPSISKSDGTSPYGDQRFVIVYQQTFNPGVDEDIYACLLTWYGSIVTVNDVANYGANSNILTVDYTGDLTQVPAASSPTQNDGSGVRQILIVAENDSYNAGDITGTVIDQNGNYVAGNYYFNTNITALENDATRLAWGQYRPSVDSDGNRFVVGYIDNFNNLGDLDTRCDLVAVVAGNLVVQEAGVILDYSTTVSWGIQVCGKYSTSGGQNLEFCCVNQDNVTPAGNPTTGTDVNAYHYHAPGAGGFSSRSTGCGGLSIGVSGSAVISESFTITVGSAYFLTGFIIGTPIPATVLGPCPTCTLGVNGFGVVGNPLYLTIPPNTGLVGATVSFQGFTFASGPCLGSISLSDTIDVTIQ